MQTNYVLIDYENVGSEDLSALKQDHFRVIVFVGACQSKIPFETAAALQQMGSNAEYVKISDIGPDALDFHIAFYIGQFAAKDPEACFYIVSKDAGFDPLLKHLKTRKLHAFRVKTVRDIPLLKADKARSTSDRIVVIVDDLHKRGAAKTRKVTGNPRSTADRIALIVDDLHKPGAAKPRTVTGNPRSTANRIAVIVDDLHKRGAAKPRKLGALPVKAARDIPLLKSGKARSTADQIAVIVDDLRRRGGSKPRTLTTLTGTIRALFMKLSPDEIGALLTTLQARGYVSVVGNKIVYSLPT